MAGTIGDNTMRFMIENVEQMMELGEWSDWPPDNRYPFEVFGGERWVPFHKLAAQQLKEIDAALKASERGSLYLRTSHPLKRSA
jgi:hypothetical protein